MSTIATLYPLLKEMGLDDEKSQQFIETIADGLAENLATKIDITNLRAEVKEDIANLKAEILKWMFGVWVTIFLAIIALFLKI